MTETVVDPGLVLKVTPPKLRRNLLARERLRRLASEEQDIAVFVVEAPAGYGKTSLLAQWRLDWLQAGAVVAWLSLDAEDSPVTLISGIVMGLRRSTGKPRFGMEALEAVRHGTAPSLALTSLLAEIAESAHSTVLMFDNCERVRDPEGLEAFAYLLHNLPPNLQIVVGSRPPAPLQTIDLVGQGNLRRVTAADLRFELAESIHFLASRLGARVNPDLCARLHESVDGWPLGLQMATAALDRTSDAERTVQAFSTTSDDATKSLFDGMFDSLSPEVTDFATRCSLLDALHPELCEAATGREEAGLWLQQLLAETPLLTATEDGNWLRLHPLAREYLRTRADFGLSEAARRDVHTGAWRWLAANGFPARAASHALAAGFGQQALDLVAAVLNDEWEAGHNGVVSEWLARIPPEQVRADARLRLDALWQRMLGYQAESAASEGLALAEDPATDEVVRNEAFLALAAGYSYSDQLEAARALVARVESRGDESRVGQILANLRAALAMMAGLTEEGRRSLSRIPGDRKMPVIHIWAEYFTGFSYLWEGRPLLAEQVARVQLARWEAEVGRRGEWASLVASVLATACWQRDLREEAASLLANRLDVIERIAPPDAVIHSHRTLARLAFSTGDEAHAFRYLEALATIGANRGVLRFIVTSLAERVRLHAIGRRLTQAAAQLAEMAAVLDDSPTCRAAEPLLRLEQSLAQAIFAIASNDRTLAADPLARAAILARDLNRGYETVQVLALQALVLEQDGHSGARVLLEALSRAEAGGLVRVFADTLREVVDLVGRLANEGRTEPVSRAYVERVLASAATNDAGSNGALKSSKISSGSPLLTPKEAEVLQLLAGGRPNKVIAAELGLSSDTVKWHIKKLFAKLNAGSREHAVGRARMLGVLR